MVEFLNLHKDEIHLGLVLIADYLISKTTLVKSNSLIEIVLSAFVKIFKK